MGTCGLYLGRREVGRLHWEPAGSRLRLRASCPCEPGWIYRVVVHTDHGEHRLGVMLPEAERFTLSRDIPAGEVPHHALIDRTLPGEAHLPGLPLAFPLFPPGQKLTALPARGSPAPIGWEYGMYCFRWNRTNLAHWRTICV